MPFLDEIFSLEIPLLETFARGSLIYLGLFFILRFCLRRQSSDLGVSDLLVIVLIADAFQEGLAPEGHTILDGFFMAATILFWAFFLDWLAFRVPAIERMMRAKEVMLVEDGRAIRKNMKKEFVTMDELLSQIRLAGFESLAEIRAVFIEGDGKFSIIAKHHDANQKPESRIGI